MATAVSTRKVSRSRYFRSMTETPLIPFFAAVFSNFSTVQPSLARRPYFAPYILMESTRRVNPGKGFAAGQKGDFPP